jgi:hypothetical protein
MGRAKRWRVERLAEKLLNIRLSLNLSQKELIKELKLDGEIYQGNISEGEFTDSVFFNVPKQK